MTINKLLDKMEAELGRLVYHRFVKYHRVTGKEINLHGFVYLGDDQKVHGFSIKDKDLKNIKKLELTIVNEKAKLVC